METPRNSDKIWRVIDLINWADEYFKSRNFDNPRLEIEWLLRELLKCSRVDLYLRFEEPITSAQLEILRAWVKRRLDREPLQYITGTAEFYGLTLKVNPLVLIPRPETERVVDVAIHTVGNIKTPHILDVGTGSGCIAVALAKELPGAAITAIDVSGEAIEVARQNAELHSITNLELECKDILTQEFEDQFDLVVSNPPYVPVDELMMLTKDIHDFEPHVALTDNGDGLTFYHRFAEITPRLIRSGGWLVAEVGLGQHPQKVVNLFNTDCFSSVELIQDYNGDNRVLKVWIK